MIKSSIIKRLEAVENSISSGVNILIFDGLPPIHMQVSKGTGEDYKCELKLFDSMEEAKHFLETFYPGVDVLIIKCGDNVLSADVHKWAG